MFSNISLNSSTTVSSIMKQNVSRAPLGNISNFHLRQWNNVNFHQVDSPRGTINKKSYIKNSPRIYQENQKPMPVTPMGSIYREMVQNRRKSMLREYYNDKENTPMGKGNERMKKSPSKIPLARIDMFGSPAKTIRSYITTKKSPSRIPVKVTNNPKISPNTAVTKKTPPPKPARKTKLSFNTSDYDNSAKKMEDGLKPINSSTIVDAGTPQMITEVAQIHAEMSLEALPEEKGKLYEEVSMVERSTLEVVETPRKDSRNTADELSTIEISPMSSSSFFNESPVFKKTPFDRHDVVRKNLNLHRSMSVQNGDRPKISIDSSTYTKYALTENNLRDYNQLEQTEYEKEKIEDEKPRCLKCVHSKFANSTAHGYLDEENGEVIENKKSDFAHINGEAISPIRKDVKFSSNSNEDEASSTSPTSSESSSGTAQIAADTVNTRGLPNFKIYTSATSIERRESFDTILEYGDNSYAVPDRVTGTYSVIVNVTEAFFRLKEEADRQCCIMKQASKALDYCKTYKLVNVDAMIEAEKIMLLASTKYDVLLTEMRDNLGKIQNYVKNVGSVQIGALIIDLKTQRKEKEWFIAVLSHREQVFNTEMIEVFPHRKHLVFDEDFTFTNVNAGFKIKIDIYSYKLKLADKKALLNKSFYSLLKRTRKLFSAESQTNAKTSKIIESSFKLAASLEMSVDNLTNQESNTFTKVDSNSSITGDLKVDAYITNLKLETFKRGYVNIGVPTNYGMVWNRLWGIVTSNDIKFWNCLSEEHDVAPTLTITLNPKGTKVVESNRNECVKPKTLILYTDSGDKYFFNTGSTYEMMDWKMQINSAIQAAEKIQFLRSQRCINY